MNSLAEEELDCDDPENKDNPDCQCKWEDDAYDRWADDQVEMYYEVMEERHQMYRTLLELWDKTDDRGYKQTHTNNVDERDNLERRLVRNLTGEDGLWRNINSIHHHYQDRNDPDKKKEKSK